MSRVSLIEQLYVKRKSALEFNYDALTAPPIRSIFTQQDIDELYRIATSLKYSANMEKKYELIDAIMKARGFKKAHSGTNRVVYNFLENPTFVAKVALDKVGLRDSPAEYKNQEFFKPFCCKIFEVVPTGVLAFVERVNPITSLEEFQSIADDIFNMMITKIIGKYVVDDLGSEKFMNYGLRYNTYTGHTFGPVIIDFPYAYELDGAKLICHKTIVTPNGEAPCMGEIDYDIGFNHLICTKCGRKYTALDLQKNTKDVLIMHNGEGSKIKMRIRLVTNGKIIMDSGMTSKNKISKEEYESITSGFKSLPVGEEITSDIIIRRKRTTRQQKYDNFMSELQKKYYKSMHINDEPFNTAIKTNDIIISDLSMEKDSEINNEIYQYDDNQSFIISDLVDNELASYLPREKSSEEDNPLKTTFANCMQDTYKIPSYNDIAEDRSLIKNGPIEDTPPIEDTSIEEDTVEDIIDTQESANSDAVLSIGDRFKEMDANISPAIVSINNEQTTTKTDEEESKNESEEYVSVYDYHADDDNYAAKRRRANKRKFKKDRNKGFNDYSDMDDF